MLENFFNWVFAEWHHTVVSMFIFFNLLYWITAASALQLVIWMDKKQLASPVDNHAIYPGQQRKEIWNSLVSIAIFSLQGIFIQQGIQNGWWKISYALTWYCVPQILILFLWNEIHFYVVHRLLHSPLLIRYVHSVHHQSKEPTVFSTYSFHWIEAFLLGTVIIFPMAIFPFQLAALLSLPVMSILLNTLGHCNYEFFPGKSLRRAFQFSHRHSLHHKNGKGNYGFMLSWLDELFQTQISNNRR